MQEAALFPRVEANCVQKQPFLNMNVMEHGHEIPVKQHSVSSNRTIGAKKTGISIYELYSAIDFGACNCL